MQLGGALQVSQSASHPVRQSAIGRSTGQSVSLSVSTLQVFTALATGRRVPVGLLGLAFRDHPFCSVPLCRWRAGCPCTRCTCTARRARRAACCSASPTARWRRGGLRAGSRVHLHQFQFARIPCSILLAVSNLLYSTTMNGGSCLDLKNQRGVFDLLLKGQGGSNLSGQCSLVSRVQTRVRV